MKPIGAKVAHNLAEAGVRAVFGIPGSGVSYDVITSCEDRGIPYFGTSHEAAAAIMAGAFGRQSATVGCALSIKGPGLANMVPGIASNHFERWPTVTLAEAVGPRTPAGRTHKRLDQRALLSSLVKAYAACGDPDELIPRLVQSARAEVPGPVHLDLVAGDAAAFVEYPVPRRAQQGGWADVLRLVTQAQRPLVIVGSWSRRSEWREQLGDLRVPVFTTLAAKGVLDERLPHAAGVFTGDGKALSTEAALLPEADLVIGLGLRNTEILNPAAITGPLVLIDAVLTDDVVGLVAAATCAPGTTPQVEALLAQLERKAWGEDTIARCGGALRQRLLEHPWLPPAVFETLAAAAPEAVLVADTGSFCTIAEHLWRATDPNGFLCSANGRYMGTSIPMAIGGALAQRERPVICAMGDGGAAMYFAEIKLAIAEALPILFLLLSDGGYGSVAAAVAPDRRRASVLAMRQPPWFEAARALGCHAECVADRHGLRAIADQWRRALGPWFVEARFDAQAYVQMTEGLR
jgi:acetolactate synthase-1/2/3 large subunit